MASSTITTTDGTITKLKMLPDQLAYSIGDKPLETSRCSFNMSVLSLSNSSDDITTNTLVPVSFYFVQFTCIGEAFEVPNVVIGVTPISQLDRLVDVCLMKMVLHEEALFDIKCHCTSIRLQLHLHSLEDVKELYEMTGDELFSIACLLKMEGINLFSKNQIQNAFQKFSKSLKFLILIDDILYPTLQKSREQLICTLKNNLAGCQIACKNSCNWKTVILLCNHVLLEDQTNVKALYRRGCAHLELQDYEKCEIDLTKAKQLDPSNLAVQTKLIFLEKQKKQKKQMYSKAMQKMFSSNVSN